MSDNVAPKGTAIPEFVMEIKRQLSDPKYVEQCLKALIEDGFLAKRNTGSAHYITEKGKKWLHDEEVRLTTAARKPSAKVPSTASDDAKALLRSFRVPTTKQVQKTAKRLIKVNRDGKTVVDKRVAAELRTFAYKMKLAKELERDSKKPSPD